MRTSPFVAAAALMLASATAYAQADTAVLVEAESGTLGSSVSTGTVGDITYIHPAVNGAGTSPGTADKVASYSVTFPAAGEYDLYAKMFVGPDGDQDDSLFYARTFGTVAPATEADWVTANGFGAASGYDKVSAIIGDGGSATTEVWKWVKLSSFGSDNATFTVPAGALTQTFMIGVREDGLLIDKFAFGSVDYHFTVEEVEGGLPGTPGEIIVYDPPGPPIASGKSKWLGSAYSSVQAVNFEDYWNQVTPENAGKWGSVEQTRDTMNWTGLDEAYNYAKSHGFPFRMHVLVWGQQQPSWITALTPTEQLEEIKEWFAAVAARYPDIDYLEVVNEALHAPPDGTTSGTADYADALGGAGTTGWDWIIEAFTLARQYFPDTPLVLNDYSITGQNSETDKYLAIINLLNDRDLIDIIGIQQHAFETKNYGGPGAPDNMPTHKANLDRLAATGLPIMITEMDVDGPTDAQQLADYQRIFPVFWEHPAVIGITLWGYRIGLWRTEEGAYLVDDFGYERPALEWLRSYVQSSEAWLGFEVDENWADTGDWWGPVYVAFAPWVYIHATDQWVWMEPADARALGSWGYVPVPTAHTPDTAAGNWLGYAVSGGWADTGDWLGKVYVDASPWIWSDLGWSYADVDGATAAGSWFWFFVQ